MKNEYAKKLQIKKQLDRHVTMQLMADAAMIAAHKVFGAGQKRCTEFHRELCNTYEEMAKICAEDTKDMEYTKSVVDRKLKEIFGDSVQPWDERYSL